ncbi:hypothetical protein [Streptomyces sp. NBC_00588]|nr:hypothetical protein [Streptomyces sp. NBC_00588]WUB38272.1 hypothetical protein OHN38_26480 [Streptomyces sp. NBC_00588]
MQIPNSDALMQSTQRTAMIEPSQFLSEASAVIPIHGLPTVPAVPPHSHVQACRR